MQPRKISTHKKKGFTLVEMAVVIAIGGLLLGYGLSVLTAQLTSTRIKTTQNQANVIKTALITFLATNNRFPCPAIENLPDTNAAYGLEDPTVGCTGTTALLDGIGATVAARGIVPWISLGLADTATLDGWNRRFTYVVTTCLNPVLVADCAPTSTSQTELAGLTVNTQTVGQRTVPGMRGNLTVHSATAIALGLPGTGNQINACSTTAGDNSCNNFAVVAIISHGANGSGAFLPQSGNRELLPAGANEQENTDTDPAFTQMGFIGDAASPGGVYDDFVLWLPPAEFTIPLQASGFIPSAQGLLDDRIAKIERVLLGGIISDSNDPDGPPVTLPCDCATTCTGGCGRSVHHRVSLADIDNDGVANAQKILGTVPYLDLGLKQRDAMDPWGQPILYETFQMVSAANILPFPPFNDPLQHGVYSSSVDSIAYRLTSFGPDRVDDSGGGDDVVYTRLTSDLVGTMAGARVPVD